MYLYNKFFKFKDLISIIKYVSNSGVLQITNFKLSGVVSKTTLLSVDSFKEDLKIIYSFNWSYSSKTLEDELYWSLYHVFAEIIPFGFDKAYSFEWNVENNRLKVFDSDKVYKFRV